MRTTVEAERRFVAEKAQQEPDLLLADAQRLAGMPPITLGQAVAQPAGRGPDQLDMPGLEAGFLLHFADRAADGVFIALDVAAELGILEGFADSFTNEGAD